MARVIRKYLATFLRIRTLVSGRRDIVKHLRDRCVEGRDLRWAEAGSCGGRSLAPPTDCLLAGVGGRILPAVAVALPSFALAFHFIPLFLLSGVEKRANLIARRLVNVHHLGAAIVA